MLQFVLTFYNSSCIARRTVHFKSVETPMQSSGDTQDLMHSNEIQKFVTFIVHAIINYLLRVNNLATICIPSSGDASLKINSSLRVNRKM